MLIGIIIFSKHLLWDIRFFSENWNKFIFVFSAGGWILDGFPQTKEQFTAMVNRGIVPDDVIVFRDDTDTKEVLVSRWRENNVNGILVFFYEISHKRKHHLTSLKKYERWEIKLWNFNWDLTFSKVCLDLKALAFPIQVENLFSLRNFKYTQRKSTKSFHVCRSLFSRKCAKRENAYLYSFEAFFLFIFANTMFLIFLF